MGSVDLPLVPVRMLNEFVYCPRLALLEWMDGEFVHSADTMEGAVRHASVDRPGSRARPKAHPERQEGEPPNLQLRSVELSDAELGLIAKLDLVELAPDAVQPVDTKKGKRPHVPRGAYDPERVQVCAQGLLLRRHGYRCDSGVLYYAGSNERVRVEFDEELIGLTMRSLRELRDAASRGQLPPPLSDSPKCVRCSLAPICLPDEIRFLRDSGRPPRQLVPSADHSFPLYVQQPGSTVRKKGDVLEVWEGDEKVGSKRVREVSQLVLMGRVQATEPVYRELLRLGVPVVHLSASGWLYGVTDGLPHRNVALRQLQYRAADDPEERLRIARRLVRAKLLNQRTFLRRNLQGDAPEELLDGLRNAARAAERAASIDSLLGHEGTGARLYFGQFGSLLRAAKLEPAFDFAGRNRRPPRDPVNALLSFAYSMLSREWLATCRGVGFDPYLGFLHAPRYGRPALALDMMEAFRPLVADSAVIRAINNGEVTPRDFVRRLGSVNLTPHGRRRFLRAFEQRLAQEVAHPVFGYRASYRRIFEVEARLLGRYLTGEVASYDPIVTR